MTRTPFAPDGPVTLLETFEGRRQLIAYYFMWHKGHPAAEQCEGCTWVTTQVTELPYLHSRNITYAVFCQGPYEDSARYRDFSLPETGYQPQCLRTIGKTRTEGCSASWRIVFLAVTHTRAEAISSPVFVFLSKRGKLLLLISSRIRCPF